MMLTNHGLIPGYLMEKNLRKEVLCPCGREALTRDHYLNDCQSTLNISRELAYVKGVEVFKVMSKIGKWLDKQFNTKKYKGENKTNQVE